MAAAGLLQKLEDPIQSAVRCGLEMASALADAHMGWAVRVGVHSGPVVAGIVGEERYQFDVWGDTVNVAARMTGKAHPGGVAITKDIWDQISGEFQGDPLGELDVKGKGIVSAVEVRAERAR
jgi:class 3 adenylate cyclase